MAPAEFEARDHELLVGGERVSTGTWDEIPSPYDQTPVGRVPRGDAALTTKAIDAAQAAFERADFPQHERAEALERAARLVAERVDELAATIAAEAGKPMKTATVEAQRCEQTLIYSAVEAARTLTGDTVPMDGSAAGAGKLGIVDPSPLRGRRRDQPVQLPAQPRRPQARPGARRRQLGRAQAGRPDADLGAAS